MVLANVLEGLALGGVSNPYPLHYRVSTETNRLMCQKHITPSSPWELCILVCFWLLIVLDFLEEMYSIPHLVYKEMAACQFLTCKQYGRNGKAPK